MNSQALPPGPRGQPGANLLAMRRDPIDFFSRIAAEYGDIVSIDLGAGPMLLVNHPDLIKEVLVTQDRHFEKWFALTRTRDLLGNGLLASEGEFHQRQRRLSQPAFHKQRIAGYAETMIHYSRRVTGRWQEGKEINICAEMNWLAMVIVAKTLFGADVDGEASEIRDALSEVFDLFERSILPPDEQQEFDEARRRLDETIYRIVRERRASGEDRGDLLSMLLSAHDTEADGSGMTDRQIRDEAMTIFLAGHETTASTLSWTWHLLGTHPEAAAGVEREIDSVLGGRTPTIDDMPRLVYCRKVFSEALRLYPPLWAVGRRAIIDLELGGFPIANGTVIILSQFLTQRDARFFPEPEKFDPERWSPESEAARPRFCYFPFSAGSRQCLGESFAWMEALLAIATITQGWRLEAVAGQRLELQPQLTLRVKDGIRMIPRRRNL